MRKNKKIGERNLEQEVNWRRLKKFRENWRSFEMLKWIEENWRKKSTEYFLNKEKDQVMKTLEKLCQK